MRFRRATPAGPNPRAADPEACREAALRLLERTRRTRSDLARRLRTRGFDAAVVNATLERLAAVGLVDDVEYASAFLRGHGRRPAGKRRVEQELRARGVSAADIAAAFAAAGAAGEATPDLEGARRAVAGAARRYRDLEPRVRRQRLYALLARRGFDRDAIEAALAAADREG